MEETLSHQQQFVIRDKEERDINRLYVVGISSSDEVGSCRPGLPLIWGSERENEILFVTQESAQQSIAGCPVSTGLKGLVILPYLLAEMF